LLKFSLKNEGGEMKLVTIVGARPQFIKAAAVIRAIERQNKRLGGPGITEILVHTGQHYDENMSQVFFDELEIPEPAYNLGVGSGSHGKMTGAILEKIEGVILKEDPDMVLVYGDTNSTLAGALAAAKLHVPVAHVEAGLRSFNRRMPEEINRVLTDHVSSLLFCPTETAVKNLETEGITKGVFKIGDVMFDSFLYNQQLAEKRSVILYKLGLKPKSFCLATVHREENTTDLEKLAGIFQAFDELATTECPFVVPLHPRTKNAFEGMKSDTVQSRNVQILDPVSYMDIVLLETHAKLILTDSGGIQKEAFFARVPCITLREETEWIELVEHGFNWLAGCKVQQIRTAFEKMICRSFTTVPDLYGGGEASEKIVEILQSATN
jgi:UDP-GlcNAc3NAcA epimerase